MASGDLNRIEDAFAEAVLDSGLWSRAFNDDGSFIAASPESRNDSWIIVSWLRGGGRRRLMSGLDGARDALLNAIDAASL
jgi:hypothetical protein